MDENRRRAPRHNVVLPVDIGARSGSTRDVSVSGVYFETDSDFTSGSAIEFSILMQLGEGEPPVRMACYGRVVRVDRQDSKTGVAATIDSVWFDAVNESDVDAPLKDS